MPDLVEQFESELDEILREAKLDFMITANDQAEAEMRVDTGENRASFIAGWGAGHNGNGFEPGPGEHGVPGDEAARQAARESRWGEGVSTEIGTDHAFWADEEHDRTVDNIAEALS